MVPEATMGLKYVAQDRLKWLDEIIAEYDYIVGSRFTVVGIWLYCWLDFAAWEACILNGAKSAFAANLIFRSPLIRMIKLPT